MARARNIKPGFYKNEYLAECSVWARFIYPGLWMLADREGRLEDRPKRIKGELLPFDSVEVSPLLDELQKFGFIIRYTVAGANYISIPKFTEHQNPHYNEKESVFPGVPSEIQDLPPHDEQKIQESTPHDEGANPAESLFTDSLNPESITCVDFELKSWITWWNSLHERKLVSSAVHEKTPSKGISRGWARFKKDKQLREVLRDRDAVASEIEACEFCRGSWFRLEKLFGGTNRDGEVVAVKLMEGGYRSRQKQDRFEAFRQETPF